MAAVQTYVKRALNRTPTIMQRSLGPVEPNSLEIQLPLAIYNLDIAAIANGEGLDAAQATGLYRYLIMSSGQYVATVALQENASGTGSPTSIGAEFDGPGMIVGLQQLETLDQVTSGSYEVRIIQGVRLGASPTVLWLKSNTASPDLIYIPTGPFMSDVLQAGKVYTADEFLELARPLAQQEMQNRRGGARGG
jgi:hypothetical protein